MLFYFKIHISSPKIVKLRIEHRDIGFMLLRIITIFSLEEVNSIAPLLDGMVIQKMGEFWEIQKVVLHSLNMKTFSKKEITIKIPN